MGWMKLGRLEMVREGWGVRMGREWVGFWGEGREEGKKGGQEEKKKD